MPWQTATAKDEEHLPLALVKNFIYQLEGSPEDFIRALLPVPVKYRM
jgi:hypothetical protein